MVEKTTVSNEKWTDNNIGESGAIAISESLKTNSTLTTLNLCGANSLEKMLSIIPLTMMIFGGMKKQKIGWKKRYEQDSYC